ncbi:MAG: hypothetical protein LBQ58_11320, partial [Synergistaceae bacterium]|nr:hypothetical protein [Synergistaceae bacterium]
MLKRNIMCLLVVLLVVSFSSAASGQEEFMWGVETHFRRLWWGNEFGVPGKDTEGSYQTLMSLVDELGVTMVRDGNRFVDLMPTSGILSQYSMGYMVNLLDDLKERNIVLDWVMIEADKWAQDLSGGHKPDGSCPPEVEAWCDFLGKLTQESKQYDIIQELWNEPDREKFFSGTTGEYLTLLEEGSSSIKSVLPSRKVINAGLTIDNPNKEFYDKFKVFLDNGTIDMVAIHSHGTIDVLNNNYKNNVAPHGIPGRYFFLNESGKLTETSSSEQAKDVAGKGIWAMAQEFRGYSAYYIGGLHIAPDINFDLDEDGFDKDGESPQEFYYMVDENLVRRKSFEAYKTVIQRLKGAEIDRKIHEGDGRYEYIFRRSEEKIYVAIGGASDPATIDSYFGAYDEVYDMLGQKNGPEDSILYFVKKISIPVPTYSVKLVSDGIGATGGGEYQQGETVNIYAGTPPEGKQFKNWTADRPVTFANVNNADTTFTMPSYPVVVTAHFEDINDPGPVEPVPTYSVRLDS